MNNFKIFRFARAQKFFWEMRLFGWFSKYWEVLLTHFNPLVYNTDITIMIINETGDKFIVLQMIAVYDVLFPEFFILCMMMLIMMIQVILDPNLGKWNIPSFPPHWQHRSAAPLSALSSYLLSASLSFLLLRCGCHIFPQKSCCRHQNQWKAYFPPFVPYKSTLCTIPQPPP